MFCSVQFYPGDGDGRPSATGATTPPCRSAKRSTHGEMRAFELNTVRLRDADGAEGAGYTFTVGRNGAAIDAVLAREMSEVMAGEEGGDKERLLGPTPWAVG